ncbi:MAG: DUF1616 domain-containing protein [archaeon]
MSTNNVLNKTFALLILIVAVLSLIFPSIARAIFGLLLVLFIPGYISTHAFFKKGDIDIIERIALSIGLSISFVVLTVMFSNLYLKIPITTQTIIIEIAGICLLFASITQAKKSPSIMGIYSKTINILTLKTRNPKKTLTRLAVTTLILLLLINFTYSLFLERPGMRSQNANQEYIVYDMSDMTGNTVKGIRISRPFTIDFENDLIFLGYDISPGLKRGEKAGINYYFQSKKDTRIDGLTVVTDFMAKKPVFQHQFSFPKIELKKGQIISIRNTITIPKVIDSAAYTMRISLMEEYTPIKTEDPNEVGTVYIPYYFDELYNQSMEVDAFYNMKKTTQANIAITNPSVYVFDSKIAFLGYDLSASSASQGSNFEITYYWKSLDTVAIDYTVFVHMTDPAGKIIFQQDHRPPTPTTKWSKGQIISEKYDVLVPANINDSTYLIRFGLYDQSTGKRMALTGKSIRDNAPYLGGITIRKKQLQDYYNQDMPVKIINMTDNTKKYATNVKIPNPVLIDYDPLVILGYELGELHTGKTTVITYYIKAEDVVANYTIRTLITETDGPGIISFETQIPDTRKGDTIALIIPVHIPENYGSGDSIFAFTVKDIDTGEYLKSLGTPLRHIAIKD